MAHTEYQTLWQQLHDYEADAMRLARLSKVKNTVLACVFVIHVALVCLSVVGRCAPLPSFVQNAPVLGDYLAFAWKMTGDAIWKWFVFAGVFAGVLPAVLGGVLSLVLKPFFRKSAVTPPSLDGDDTAKEQAIREKGKALEALADTFADPSLTVMGWGALLAAVSYAAYLTLRYENGLESHWFGALLLTAVGIAVIVGLDVLLVLGMTLPPSHRLKEIMESLPTAKTVPTPQAPTPAPVKEAPVAPKPENRPSHEKSIEDELASMLKNEKFRD